VIAILLALYARALDRAEAIIELLQDLWALIAETETFYCDTVAEAEDTLGLSECTW
jgi:hypothetical protein